MKHIVIVGHQGVGKSTLVRRILRLIGRPVYGFITKKAPPDSLGRSSVYIHDAKSKTRRHNRQNRIGICENMKATGNPAVFDSHAHLLQNLPHDGVVLMDELGVMEREAKTFQTAVLNALDEYPLVIAVVRDKDNDFLQSVRAHERAECFYITPETRNELYEQIKKTLLFREIYSVLSFREKRKYQRKAEKGTI
ncbi:MAG: nucleoside-triphosphatase [Clostridia bacterium]|nr:nucleoside-triphosphatase [Clostridia bacterium]